MAYARSMAMFAAGLSGHPVPTQAVGEVVGQVLDQLVGEPPDLVVLFASQHHTGAMEDVAAAVRALLSPTVLIGASASGVVGGEREMEDAPGLSVLAGRLPHTVLTPGALGLEPTPDGPAVVGWPEEEVVGGTLVLLADPFSFPADAFLDRVNEDLPALQVIGGLASAARGPGGNRLVLDGRIVSTGAVGVIIDGGIEVTTVVSQGCRPVGRPYVVTRSERNVVYELAGRPALERLHEIVTSLPPDERDLLAQGLQIGRVVDEHRTSFGRGDFLVRNVMGVDQSAGAIAIGDFVEVGQTVQFHMRDADTADEDLRALLAGADADAALLFTCNGRGSHFFGEPDHDAGLLERLVGPMPLAGCFCAGELGPVAGRNFVHGYTASVALLRS